MIKSLYLVGSLRSEYLRELENRLTKTLPDIEIFAEWHGAGKFADDEFKEYHKGKGRTYRESLQTYAAKHIFEFDKCHLDRTEGAILLMPAGKSCMLEAGYSIGKGKPVFGFFSEGEPDERWEIMLQFLTSLSYTEEELIDQIKNWTPLVTEQNLLDDFFSENGYKLS